VYPQAMVRDPAPDPADRLTAGCAAICRTLDESLAGTAPEAASGWLLIEHPGPWPAFGLPEDLPLPVTRFARRALGHGVRTQLIRRADRDGRRPAAAPLVMIAGGPSGHRWIERRTLDTTRTEDRRALMELDLASFAAAAAPGFGAAAAPVFLVCTHGRREVCCARYGRPVAQALQEQFGAAVWETTHVGGDRFAANLVLLPAGVYFGRLDPAHAVRVARLALAGELDLESARGTAGLPPLAQAAELFLRAALAATRLDAVRYLGSAGLTARFGVRHANAAAPGDPVREQVHTVEVRPGEPGAARLTSCGDGTFEAPAPYVLVGITNGG
jgi:hypothetical protein